MYFLQLQLKIYDYLCRDFFSVILLKQGLIWFRFKKKCISVNWLFSGKYGDSHSKKVKKM